MAEPIRVPFGVWIWGGARNHILDGGLIPAGEEAVFRGMIWPRGSITVAMCWWRFGVVVTLLVA